MQHNHSFDDIMARLRAGDNDAATQVFNRFANRLIELARRRLDPQIRQKLDPEDVLQSVFKSFFVRHRDGQFEPTGWNNLWTLLTVIAVRKCADRVVFFRAARRNIGRESAPDDESSASSRFFDRQPTPDEADAVADTVEHIMRGLDDRDREILTLRLQGRLVGEIAADMGCAERTVRRVLEHVKRRLRDLEANPPERPASPSA